MIQKGAFYGGGIVFYIDESELHGLIASQIDLNLANWGIGGILGTQTKLGSGKNNSLLIVENGSFINSVYHTDIIKKTELTAARLCISLNLNGYKDWFLPSKDELNLLFMNKDLVGGFSSDFYWSSSEGSYFSFAWKQNFKKGAIKYASRYDANRVRAIRAF